MGTSISSIASTDESALAPGTNEELAGPPQVAFGPVAKQERVSSIDLLRGFSLMGILVMNITDFAFGFQN
jgi:uncharacterized protein